MLWSLGVSMAMISSAHVEPLKQEMVLMTLSQFDVKLHKQSMGCKCSENNDDNFRNEKKCLQHYG